MNNPNAADNLKPFKKGDDPRRNYNGRPRKLISATIKEMEDKGVTETSKDEVLSVYLRLMNLTFTEIQEMVDDEDRNLLVRIVGKNILSGKGFDIIEKMLDRGIGKADQTVNNRHSVDKDFDVKKVFGFDKAE